MWYTYQRNIEFFEYIKRTTEFTWHCIFLLFSRMRPIPKKATRTTTAAASENWLKHLIRQWHFEQKKLMNVSFYIVIYNSSSGLSQCVRVCVYMCVRARASTVLCIGRLHFMSHSILSALLYCVLYCVAFNFLLPVCGTFHSFSLSLSFSLFLSLCVCMSFAPAVAICLFCL